MKEKRGRLYPIVFLSVIVFFAIPLFLKFMLWEVDSVENYPPPATSFVYSSDGKKIFRFYRENRVLVSFEEIPDMLVKAFLAAEDSSFFKHPGVDPVSIVRAVIVNSLNGGIRQGASTISQQLARECFLSRERSYFRKVKEAILAISLEMRYSKEEIFAFWLNHIYLGYGSYGIKVAADNYFNKDLKDLNLTECVFLASLPKAPARYFRNIDQATIRMKYVLGQMIKHDHISRIDADAAALIPFSIYPKKIIKKDHYVEHVRRYIEKKYGSDFLYNDGLEIYIAMDSRMQSAASHSVEKVLSAWDERLDAALKVEGALLSMDKNGYVKAMIGGRDFSENQWNKAIQAERQPGSSFKAFVYSAAFALTEESPETYVVDKKLSLDNPYSEDNVWRIRNYGDKYRGYMHIKDAFAFSSNTIAVKTLKKVGLKKAKRYIERFELESELPNDLTLALGTSNVSLFNMTRAYSVFANSGNMIEPIFVQKIVKNGEIVEENKPKTTMGVVDKKTASEIDRMLRYAVDYGTGKNAAIPDRRIAGKTGTSSKNRDAWFIGYDEKYITGIWVGYEDFARQLGHYGTGSSLAAPIFRNYLETSYKKEG